jgi:quercetin 2,3-dioxygenase
VNFYGSKREEIVMFQQRRIGRVVTVPPLAPGFIGPRHLHTQVVPAGDFALTDPFFMLVEDHLDIGDRPAGEPHPHAGFETVTLLLDGAISDHHEGGVIQAGEVQWMTAGRGIITAKTSAASSSIKGTFAALAIANALTSRSPSAVV